MSLAIYAAPFNTEPDNNDVSPKRRANTNNRTQKRQDDDGYNASKVNSVLNAIHNASSTLTSDSSTLADFKPISPPISVGVENTKINNPDSHNEDGDINLNDLNATHMNEQAKEQYYQQFMPAYSSNSNSNNTNNVNTNNVNTNNTTPFSGNSNVMTKLNYMIHLLEEQHDERTNNVTEEVVLYSFLGIFVIFVVDSFVRVGKYVR